MATCTIIHTNLNQLVIMQPLDRPFTHHHPLGHILATLPQVVRLFDMIMLGFLI